MFATKIQIAGSALDAHARLPSQNKIEETVKLALAKYDRHVEGEMCSIVVAEVANDTLSETVVWIKPYEIKFSEIEKIVVGGLVPIDANGQEQRTAVGILRACVYVYDVDNRTVNGGARPVRNWLQHVLDNVWKEIESALSNQ